MLLFPVSDEELVARCAAGSKEAWDAFVSRYARLIHWSIRRTLTNSLLGGDHCSHEEVFQKVFERLLDKDGLSRLKRAASLRQYLVVMSGRLAMDKLKETERSNRRFVAPEDVGAVMEDGGELESPLASLMAEPAAANQAAEHEKRRIFAGVFDELSVKEKACLEYCYLEDKSHREIAEILELPQDTVSTIIRRTKDRLRKRLLEDGFEDLFK